VSRSTSVNFRNSAYSSGGAGEVPVILLTLSHADLTDDIRLSTDNADTFVIDGVTVRGTISRGENYIFLPMDITLPDDSDESTSTAKISMCDVDRSIMETVRSIQSSPDVTMEVVLASQPDTVEATYTGFTFTGVEGDSMVVSGSLSLGSFYNEPFPGRTVLPSNFPGLA